MYTTICEYLTQNQPTIDQELPIEILDIVDESITYAPNYQSMLDMLGDIGMERLARARFIATEEGNDKILIFSMKQTVDYDEADLQLAVNKIMARDGEGLVPVIHARWVPADYKPWFYSVCTECGRRIDALAKAQYPHCPGCGAKMDLEV